jgi:hypothetical protein
MMEPRHTRHCASAAIVAALALASTPLSAQVAETPPPAAPDPVMTVPTTPAPPPAQPTIVLPTELEAAPAEAAAVDPAPRDAARTERPAPRARAAAPDPAADPEPVAVDEDLAPIAPEPRVETAAPVALSEPVAAPAVAEADNTQFWVAVLAGLAAIALAIWGFIAIGRRKPVDRKAALLIERPIVKPREPMAAPVATGPVPTPSVSPLHPAAPALSMAHTGASVPLPSRMPESFEERDALVKRMIAARPDRANPFTSPIQRRKRAKLILQSLGRDFGDAEPWIDLSQYPQNWPELARRKHAA